MYFPFFPFSYWLRQASLGILPGRPGLYSGHKRPVHSQPAVIWQIMQFLLDLACVCACRPPVKDAYTHLERDQGRFLKIYRGSSTPPAFSEYAKKEKRWRLHWWRTEDFAGCYPQTAPAESRLVVRKNSAKGICQVGLTLIYAFFYSFIFPCKLYCEINPQPNEGQYRNATGG